MKKISSIYSKQGSTISKFLLILGLLAGLLLIFTLLFPTMSGPHEEKGRSKAKQDTNQISVAVKAYGFEYKKWPVTGINRGEFTSDNKELMDILRAVSPGCEELNPRKIPFLEITNVKDPAKPKGGIGPSGTFFDPWGVPYKVRITDYNNEVKNPYTDAGPANLKIGVIAWSYGKDQKQGNGKGPQFADSDDVISWQ